MKRWMVCVSTLMVAVVLGASAADGAIVVLKEGDALTTGGALDAVFSGVSAGDVVQVPVDDTAMNRNSGAYYNNYGAATSYSSYSFVAMLVKFDLSALAGATIEKAQLRLYAPLGNSSVSLARVVTHDWTEALATRASYNGLASPNKNWGPGGDAIFDSASDLGVGAPFESRPDGAAFSVKDVTADVQAFVNGMLPNYGWGVYSSLTSMGNHDFIPSENSDNGRRPALFISFTPVPEPATLALVVMSGLMLLRRRAA